MCADDTDATLDIDRNDYFVCCAPPDWEPSEGYEYNFPSIASQYPCTNGANIDEMILTITVTSFTTNFSGATACCNDYVEGLFANLYNNCLGGTCPVIGDGLINLTPVGDCAPSGDNLTYNSATGSLVTSLPHTSVTTCLAGSFTTTQQLGVDLVPSIRYDDANANGCACPPDAVSQGLITVDYEIEVEYIFCESDLIQCLHRRL